MIVLMIVEDDIYNNAFSANLLLFYLNGMDMPNLKTHLAF